LYFYEWVVYLVDVIGYGVYSCFVFGLSVFMVVLVSFGSVICIRWLLLLIMIFVGMSSSTVSFVFSAVCVCCFSIVCRCGYCGLLVRFVVFVRVVLCKVSYVDCCEVSIMVRV